MTFNNWHLTLELRKGGALALVWVQTLEKAFSNNQLTPLQLETPKTRMMIEEEKKRISFEKMCQKKAHCVKRM